LIIPLAADRQRLEAEFFFPSIFFEAEGFALHEQGPLEKVHVFEHQFDGSFLGDFLILKTQFIDQDYAAYSQENHGVREELYGRRIGELKRQAIGHIPMHADPVFGDFLQHFYRARMS